MTQTVMRQRCALQAYDEARLAAEVGKRRNWAIISHPDAGKTTLTEKLLLYGGAIQEAGDVKARRSARHATSDVRPAHPAITLPPCLLSMERSGSVTALDAAGHLCPVHCPRHSCSSSALHLIEGHLVSQRSALNVHCAPCAVHHSGYSTLKACSAVPTLIFIQTSHACDLIMVVYIVGYNGADSLLNPLRRWLRAVRHFEHSLLCPHTHHICSTTNDHFSCWAAPQCVSAIVPHYHNVCAGIADGFYLTLYDSLK